jgi:hypothetical protein
LVLVSFRKRASLVNALREADSDFCLRLSMRSASRGKARWASR